MRARSQLHAAPAAPDADSAAWLADLTAAGPRRDQAVERLHALLLRAARFEVGRRRGLLGYMGEEELDALAQHAAGDALLAVLSKLGDYRGLSRFTTWAYKFALLEAGVKVQRRRMWRRDIPLEPGRWEQELAAARGPAAEAQLGELLEAVSEGIKEDLTAHQRRVLVALAIEGLPIDVLADRLSTTRGALYKTLHDARRKLRHALAKRGMDLAAALGEDRDGA